MSSQIIAKLSSLFFCHLALVSSWQRLRLFPGSTVHADINQKSFVPIGFVFTYIFKHTAAVLETNKIVVISSASFNSS